VLLAAVVPKWSDVTADRAAWDVFVWYGGLFEFARALGEAGVPRALCGYGLASIRAHTLAMYPAFGAVMLA